MTVGAAIILGAALLTWRFLPETRTADAVDDDLFDDDGLLHDAALAELEALPVTGS